MCLIPKLRGKKVVVTIHGLDWARAKWGGFATKYIKWGEKQAVKHADEIIVLSKGVQNYFLQEYGRKTVFIPNGVSRPERLEANEITVKWGLKKDSYVLFLGRIVPEKGLQYLVEAWKGIRSDKKLVIVGGSSDTWEFMDELKKESGDEVLFTGFQQGRILAELYSNAYIYTLPSDLEGMPLSLLEAMSYGNCCLVSNIDECREVVEDKAVLFTKGNVDELRKALQVLLDDPEKVRGYKSSAAEYITKKYNWDDVVGRTLEIYSK
jgi:glycosyltransferase involved in cell wall biosynthesis